MTSHPSSTGSQDTGSVSRSRSWSPCGSIPSSSAIVAEAPTGNRRAPFVHSESLAAAAYTHAMAATVTERKLLLDGEWVETGEWVEVSSPFDGSTVARVAKAGATEARAAIDAAERAMREPLPAHKRAEILVRVAGSLGKRADEAARLISAEAGKPLKAARVEVARAMSTYTMAAVEARKLTGTMVPMDARRPARGSSRSPSGSRSASSARSARSTSRSTSSRTRSLPRSPPGARSC